MIRTSTTVRGKAALLPDTPLAPSHLPVTDVRVFKNIIVIHADSGASQRPAHPADSWNVSVTTAGLQVLVLSLDICGVDVPAAIAIGGYPYGWVFRVIRLLIGGK